MINLKGKKNKMKKIFILSSFLVLFYSSISFAVDCSDYSVFSHKWNMCKMGKLKIPKIGKSKTETTTKTSSEATTETSSEEQTLLGKTKSKTTGVVKRLKSKTLWSMITGKESGKKEDKANGKSLWDVIKGDKD
tara:strand:- start:141 stop:542 length:402 start_codon:yes stop_codon:yes gene_type:complete